MTELIIIMTTVFSLGLAAIAAFIAYAALDSHRSRTAWKKSIDEYQKARDAIASYQTIHNSLTSSVASLDKKVDDMNHRVSALSVGVMRK